MSDLRVRFAPSPTGYLHIGGARTALFNYLLAQQQKGTFVLRIEDTDVARSTQESVDAILDAMEWLGLSCDEGPIYQSDRFDLYKEKVQQLLDEGKAYRCYCTSEELDAKREVAMKEGRKLNMMAPAAIVLTIQTFPMSFDSSSLKTVMRSLSPIRLRVISASVQKS